MSIPSCNYSGPTGRRGGAPLPDSGQHEVPVERGRGPGLLDGGAVSPPTFRFFDRDGWQVEGIGVSPDIEVVDRPDRVARGDDPTLDKAIEVLMAELAKKSPVPVKRPAAWVDRP